jgi:Protein of unknown function (DUF4244)
MTRRTTSPGPAAAEHQAAPSPTDPPAAAIQGDGERGAATAEYAIATMAAVAFAGLLVVILQSDEVRQILTDLVRQALTYTG